MQHEGFHTAVIYERVSDGVDDFGQRSNNLEDGVHTVHSGYHLVVEAISGTGDSSRPSGSFELVVQTF
jgi:hypothetical protein